jgi:hypothetical protein
MAHPLAEFGFLGGSTSALEFLKKNSKRPHISIKLQADAQILSIKKTFKPINDGYRRVQGWSRKNLRLRGCIILVAFLLDHEEPGPAVLKQ